MSSTSTWTNIDGTFSYEDFYWRIVTLFEDEEEAAELIKFYNQKVLLFDLNPLSCLLFSFSVAMYSVQDLV